MTNSNKLADALREMLETYERPWSLNRPEWVAAIEQALAEHGAQPAQGEWVLAPREPTEAMIDEGMRSIRCDLELGRKPQERSANRAARNAYVTMLSAAPQPAPAPVQPNPNDDDAFLGEMICARAIVSGVIVPAAPVQVDASLGRFGHHPDPATDFEVEVESLQGRLFDAKHAIPGKHGVTESIAQVADAINRAMAFRVGGVETSVRAKSILRALELEAAHPPAPAADGAGEHVAMLESMIADHAWIPGVKERAALRAAIAALRQPVPDAVRELPGKWRHEADEIAENNLACNANSIRARADELEYALASQQESRNA